MPVVASDHVGEYMLARGEQLRLQGPAERKVALLFLGHERSVEVNDHLEPLILQKRCVLGRQLKANGQRPMQEKGTRRVRLRSVRWLKSGLRCVAAAPVVLPVVVERPVAAVLLRGSYRMPLRKGEEGGSKRSCRTRARR